MSAEFTCREIIIIIIIIGFIMFVMLLRAVHDRGQVRRERRVRLPRHSLHN